MAISSAGIGSNIDVNSLVSQLLAIESRPLDRLNQTKSDYNAKLSAFGKIASDLSAFQSAVSALKDASGFKIFKATPDNTDYLTASADSSASAGNHDITVGTLAKAQKLFTDSADNGRFADIDTTTVGTGTLTFTAGTNSFNVTIDSSNNTLNGIVEAINSNVDNFGVSASIVNDGTGYLLQLSPNESGTTHALTITTTDTGDSNNTDNSGLSRLSTAQLNETQAASNATLTVDGLTGITKQTNTITDVIQGVTLNLKTPGVTTTLAVDVDTDAIASKVQDFANAYNKLVDDIKGYRGKGALLEADNTLLTIQAQLTSIFNTPAGLTGNAFNSLAEVGVSIQATGKIAVNTSDFKTAAGAQLNDVVKLFTDSTGGFFQRFYTETTNLLQANGVVDAKTHGINDSISSLNIRIDQTQVRLNGTERRLRAQFSALDGLLGSLKSTASLLIRQLG